MLVFIKQFAGRCIVAKDVVVGAEGLGFESRDSQIGHSVANDLSPLRCFFGTVLLGRKTAEMDPATRYRENSVLSASYYAGRVIEILSQVNDQQRSLRY